MKIILCFLLVTSGLSSRIVLAQEFTAPLPENPALRSEKAKPAQYGAKPTALGLPFFEDFTNTGPAPSTALWINNYVFVNNNMANNIKSRGCATFDALDQYGIPYDSMAPYHQVYADSLTSATIDLSTYSAADSLYLSFYYQPQGNGFAPKTNDSLMLFFRREDGGWNKVWSVPGDTLHDFKAVNIVVADTNYFHSGFQFCFLNKATHGVSNPAWNVDYILLDKNRNYKDTLLTDIAFTKTPESLLNDFTAMPFKQFMSNPSAFVKNTTEAYLRNNGTANVTLHYGLETTELTTGTGIGSGSDGTAAFQPDQEQAVALPVPDIASFQPPDPEGKFVFENKFYVDPAYSNEHLENDTITQNQVFDNYFAYDDGTAEQAYFLHLYPSAPGKIAEEFALYVPDTLRGIAVYFPRQVPSAVHKEFSLVVYKTIAINGHSDNIIYQEDFLTPKYDPAPNGFSTYAFKHPVALPTGVFYIALVQSAGGSSDSLYIGLDKSRTEANHRYFNIDGRWENSLIDGALLMRPLIGKALPPTGIVRIEPESLSWILSPNPAKNQIRIQLKDKSDAADLHYQIFDLQGRLVQSGQLENNKTVPVGSLKPGIYFVRLVTQHGFSKPQKLLKM